MNVYAQMIRERVPTTEAATAYGMQVDRRGWACCPFHAETKPSLRVYGGDRGFCCFGCGEKGSVIDLCMKLYGLTARQAMRKLNEDFALGLPLDKPPDWRERNRLALDAARMRQAELAQKQAEARAVAEWERAFSRWLYLDRMACENSPNLPVKAGLEQGRRILWAHAVKRVLQAKYEAETAHEMMIEVLERGRRGEWRPNRQKTTS